MDYSKVYLLSVFLQPGQGRTVKIMEQDRDKWNSRYESEEFFLGPHSSRFLAGHIAGVEAMLPGRKALDIACGEGRNSIFLAGRGYEVTGIDIADRGLAKAAHRAQKEGFEIVFIRQDLEITPLSGQWDLIINFNFLLRDLIPQEIEVLSPGGVIMFETLLDTPRLPEGHNPDFFLQPGELASIFARFAGTIHYYDECPLDESPVAHLIFQKA
jgi:tellurite methyltransferase